ncbi:hypothetical protein [Aminobacter phage Erebus]|nr:hypothetical protein [Aminobacter phage Erebus]
MAEKKIGTRTFKVEPLLATDALVLQARLFRAVGPAATHFKTVMAARGEGEETAMGAAAVAALAEIFAKSEPTEIAGLIKDTIEVAQIKRPSGVYENCDFDGDFTGQSKDIIPVALFVLQEQFGDFFTGLLAAGNLKRLAAKA